MGSRRFTKTVKPKQNQAGDSNGKGTISEDEAARERRDHRPR
jgi:hypothetical protein